MGKSRKMRVQKTSIYIIGEGAHECAFFDHLKNIYHDRSAPFNIYPDKGSGGSPLTVVQRAKRLTANKDYNFKYILIDTDVELGNSFKTYCDNYDFIVLKSVICFSCELAKIAGVTYCHENYRCKSAVREFLCNNEPTCIKTISQKYPKELLDRKRCDVPLLHALIELFSNGTLTQT